MKKHYIAPRTNTRLLDFTCILASSGPINMSSGNENQNEPGGAKMWGGTNDTPQETNGMSWEE